MAPQTQTTHPTYHNARTAVGLVKNQDNTHAKTNMTIALPHTTIPVRLLHCFITDASSLERYVPVFSSKTDLPYYISQQANRKIEKMLDYLINDPYTNNQFNSAKSLLSGYTISCTASDF